MQNRRSFIAGTTTALCAAATPLRSFAQPSSKPLRIIVPYPPGGSTDVLARLIASKLQGTYAASVIVENKTGAAGRIAMDFVKNSDPNSGTVLINSSSSFSVYPYVYKKLGYSPLTDFTPVSTLCDFEFTINAGPAVPSEVKTLPELVRWVKADAPSRGKIAIPAIGTILHFTATRVAQATGMELSYVPYRGGPPAVADVLGGHTPLGFMQVGDVVQHVDGGKLRIFGMSGAQRSPILPNVPTFKEMGFDVEVAEWFGLLMPAKAPPGEVAQLNAAVRDALASAEIKDGFRKMSFKPRGESPAEFAKLIRSDYEQWGPIVKATGFTVEE
ncbi:twin-arginine translocation pathway signal protein [Variovorax paradoxus]|nr:twin-arginine translocation pathway signal protein [Variovorax paradoxus]